MSLRLKPHEVCQYTECPCQKDPSENGYCQGLNPNRSNWFECSFVNENGEFLSNQVMRTKCDITGGMQILHEDNGG